MWLVFIAAVVFETVRDVKTGGEGKSGRVDSRDSTSVEEKDERGRSGRGQQRV